MNTLQHTHEGTVITYNEKENKWEFTLRGRDRSAESLAKAKEFIERPVPEEKAKPFKKIPAWFFHHAQAPQKVEVTGIAERTFSSLLYVWINNSGKRSKECVSHTIYPSTPANDEKVAEMLKKAAEIEHLEEEYQKLKSSLTPLELPKDE
jgi:hypothetical protein